MKHPRRHDEAHLSFLRTLHCVVCGDNTSVEAAHLRAGNLQYGKRPAGMQEKPDDAWCIPLCSRCHRRQHQGNEVRFWTNEGINPWVVALSLYAASGDAQMADEIINGQCGHRQRF